MTQISLPYLRAVSSYIDLLKSLDSPTVDDSIAQLYLYRIGVDPYNLIHGTGKNPISASDFISKKTYLKQHTKAFEYFINTCLTYNIEGHIKTLIEEILTNYRRHRSNTILDPMDRTRFTRTQKHSRNELNFNDDGSMKPSTISPTTERHMREVIEAYVIDPSDNGMFTRLRSRDYKHGTSYQRVAEIAQMTKADSYAYHQRESIPFDTILQYLKIFTDDKNNPTRIMEAKSDAHVAWDYQQNLHLLETVFFIVCMFYNLSASQLFANDIIEQPEDAWLSISDTAIAVLPSVEQSVLRAFQNKDGHRMTHLSMQYIKYMRYVSQGTTFVETREPSQYDVA